jgi:hypothetical protein
MTHYTIDNNDRFFGYIWTLKGYETETKFGDTFVNANETPLEECNKRIRESLGVRKDLFDDGSVTLHQIIDLTDFAKSYNRFYKGAKVDNLVREHGKNSLKRVKGGDVHFATPDELIRDINDLLHGNKNLKSFKMRGEQVLMKNNVVNHFNHYMNLITTAAITNGISKRKVCRVLINAVMRFGKSHVTYQIIKEMGFKRVLILTYKPSGVKESWKEDLDHVDFGNFDFYKASDMDKVTFTDTDRTQIIFASFQDCIGNIDGQFKDKWLSLFDQEFDLVVKDEDHYGYETEKSNNFLNNLKYTFEISLSGTPFKAILDGKYKQEEVFAFTHLQSQQLKQEEIDNGLVTKIYQSLPSFEVIIPKYNTDLINNFKKYYSKGEEVTNFKIFSDTRLIQEFLTWVALDPQMRTYKTNHQFWLLPGVNHCNLVEECLKKHPYWGQYQIINASGDNEKDIDKAKNLVYERHPYSITLSCGRWNTGSTVKQWDSVWMLNDGNSAENWFQTGFRPGTPYVDSDGNILKNKCYIIDFNQDRVLRSFVHYSIVIAKHTGYESGVYAKELMKCMPIFALNGVNMIQLDSKLLQPKFDEINKDHLGSKRITNINLLDTETDLILSNMSLSDKDYNREYTQVLNENSIGKGKNYEVTTIEEPKIEEEKLKNLEVILLNITKKFGNFLYVIDDIRFIEDINNNPEEFELFTNITPDNFMTLINKGLIEKELLEESIEFSNIQKHYIMN